MDRTTKLARISAIRASALLIIRDRGEWRGTGPVRCVCADFGDLHISYRTPFQKLWTPSEIALYVRALVGGKANLPYGLDI